MRTIKHFRIKSRITTEPVLVWFSATQFARLNDKYDCFQNCLCVLEWLQSLSYMCWGDCVVKSNGNQVRAQSCPQLRNATRYGMAQHSNQPKEGRTEKRDSLLRNDQETIELLVSSNVCEMDTIE